MKQKVIIILSLIILISCTQLKYVPKYENIFVLDFTKYADLGFLITPEPYNGKYESIGLLNIILRPEANLITIEIPLSESMQEKTGRKNKEIKKHWVMGEFNQQIILDLAYEESVKLNGNAIMNFRIYPNDEKYATIPPLTIPGIEIHGFIIKRLD
jgi:hypothetical protein